MPGRQLRIDARLRPTCWQLDVSVPREAAGTVLDGLEAARRRELPRPADPPIAVLVKRPGRRTLCLHVDVGESTAAFRQRLSGVVGAPHDSFYLLCKGKLLLDGRSLAESGLQSGGAAVVWVCARERGGMFRKSSVIQAERQSLTQGGLVSEVLRYREGVANLEAAVCRLSAAVTKLTAEPAPHPLTAEALQEKLRPVPACLGQAVGQRVASQLAPRLCAALEARLATALADAVLELRALPCSAGSGSATEEEAEPKSKPVRGESLEEEADLALCMDQAVLDVHRERALTTMSMASARSEWFNIWGYDLDFVGPSREKTEAFLANAHPPPAPPASGDTE